jgi:hypothetical protein
MISLTTVDTPRAAPLLPARPPDHSRKRESVQKTWLITIAGTNCYLTRQSPPLATQHSRLGLHSRFDFSARARITHTHYTRYCKTIRVLEKVFDVCHYLQRIFRLAKRDETRTLAKYLDTLDKLRVCT